MNGPDAVTPKPASPTGTGPQYIATQYWEFTAGGKKLGDCYDNCVDEKIEFKNINDGGWYDPFGHNWKMPKDLHQCPNDKNLVVDYKPDLASIKDLKRGNLKPTHEFKEDDLMYTYRQKVGLQLERCEDCDPVAAGTFPQEDECHWFTSDWFVFEFRKGPGDSVVHKHIP